MVRLAGVRKRYRGRGEVLAGIDLQIVPGVPVGLVGGNGAGKSTLLRIAAGCASPSAGRVDGRPAVVGYLPQSMPPPARMTVLAYLRHHAAMHGTGAGPAAATAVLDDLDFTGDRAGPLAALSTGNLQKVGLAQALGCAGAGGSQDPPLLVLDEPWTALDAGAAVALERRLAGWVAAGRPLLVADHTGRAGQLPGARTHRLADGVLVEQPAAPRGPEAWATVVLRCPGPAARTLAALPPVACSWDEDGLLGLRVAAAHGDALLAAALAMGCSVVSVGKAG
ncbi:ATP-binding cassette domain-containing protein [Pseudonocardia humida]|uniref:ATP-binding cassette domain-containing protein n=1 Tax=Pseudonocardia humida TaxID=2800819 RepID=A0ABT1A806_9PSEU|nr:ATP-binding cassette domain-containing protein [Pseudonocardia humida]MCO1659157.1 ATP-binding cassette domain-containing protein [Pseudonocardia humida]